MAPRERSAWLMLTTGVLALGGVTWLSRHPDHPLVHRATDWPLVGGLAEWLRASYLDPGVIEVAPAGLPAARSGERAQPAEPPRVSVQEGRVDEGSAGVVLRNAPPPGDPRPRAWVGPASRLQREPDPLAPELPRRGVLAEVAVAERRGGWVGLDLGSEGIGWLPAADLERPPLGDEPLPARPIAGRAATPEQLARVEELLGAELFRASLGPYALLADVDPAGLPAGLAALAVGLEEVYRQRYGLALEPGGSETLVLVATPGRFEALKGDDAALRPLPAHGFVSGGLVVIDVGGRSAAEVAGTLAHEIAHLLNRRALGPSLPPWLDEGIADDLGLSEIGLDSGTLRPDSLASTVVAHGNQLEIRGAWAALSQLRAGLATQSAREFAALFDRDWASFVAAERRQLDYAASGFFVRFLLSGGDPKLRQSFLAFLAEVAAGDRGGEASLARRLGVPWPMLLARFRLWLEAREVALERAALSPGQRLSGRSSAGAEPVPPAPRDGTRRPHRG
jgi:hypothetical protein